MQQNRACVGVSGLQYYAIPPELQCSTGFFARRRRPGTPRQACQCRISDLQSIMNAKMLKKLRLSYTFTCLFEVKNVLLLPAKPPQPAPRALPCRQGFALSSFFQEPINFIL